MSKNQWPWVHTKHFHYCCLRRAWSQTNFTKTCIGKLSGSNVVCHQKKRYKTTKTFQGTCSDITLVSFVWHMVQWNHQNTRNCSGKNKWFQPSPLCCHDAAARLSNISPSCTPSSSSSSSSSQHPPVRCDSDALSPPDVTHLLFLSSICLILNIFTQTCIRRWCHNTLELFPFTYLWACWGCRHKAVTRPDTTSMIYLSWESAFFSTLNIVSDIYGGQGRETMRCCWPWLNFNNIQLWLKKYTICPKVYRHLKRTLPKPWAFICCYRHRMLRYRKCV